jgi:ADP-dependent NAD(P)H-hydrate dehydratase / NAD(P)H-hydrate epimerase
VRNAYDVATVRSAEKALAAGLPAGTLMSRAATGLARTCARLLGSVYGSRVAVLVGSGDNGGDALYAGAMLAARGAHVDAIVVSGSAHVGGLAALRSAGGRVIADGSVGGATYVGDATSAIERADLVLDGIVGIGGRGSLREPAASMVAAIPGGGVWRVAVDLPSGVDADTGHVAGSAFEADVTVTFGCFKPGHVLAGGIELAGVVELVDIGLRPTLPPSAAVQLLETADVAALWPGPGPRDDKYTRGVVGVVAGSTAYPGAAVLCTGGALGAGAGMVRYVGHSGGAAAAAVGATWPEVVHGDGRVQAYVVGPGLGTGTDALASLRRVLASDVPVLVDADALTLLAEDPDLVRKRSALTVLTPHDREYERFGSPVGDDRRGAAVRLSADLGATVLLKGFATVIAQPDGTTYANPTGTAWLATAGSGDVLSGIVGSLLAAGLGPLAPVAGAFVHGLAGRLASDGGPVSASRIAEAVPRAVAAILGSDVRIEG